MSLAAACGWTLVRSLVVVLAGWPACRALHRLVVASTGPKCGAAWLLTLAPFLFPSLLVGYAYSGASLRLGGWLAAHDRLSNEVLCGLLLVFKSVPVGVVVLYFSPPSPLSAEAAHVRRLAIRRHEPTLTRARVELSLFALGPLRANLPAFALMWLVTFQEFEIASLLNVPAWTVWLFDAQAQGIRLDESLRLAAWPLALQAMVLMPVLAASFRTRQLRPGPKHARSGRSALISAAAWGYLVIAATGGVVIPLLLVGQDAFQGFNALFRSGLQLIQLGREIRHGLFFSVVSAALALSLGAVLLNKRMPVAGWVHGLLVLLINAPGLMSSLIVALVTLALFQRTGLSAVYGTPIPMFLGLAAFLLPRAMIVELLWSSFRQEESTHLATMLSRSPESDRRKAATELSWQLHRRRQFWCVALVAWWGYLELTVASLLAPAAMVPATVRLYNQMHFGRNATLTAMTCLTVFVPVLLVFAILSLRRSCRWLIRR